MPLNSLGVQARTVSTFDTEPVAATAMPVATASDPSAASVISTTSFEPVVKSCDELAACFFDQCLDDS